MRKFIYTAAIVGLTSFTLLSCSKEAQTVAPQQQEVSQETLTQIKSLGFSNTNVQKVDEGYLVEGDIILTENDLRSTGTSQAIRVANVEQYRTNYLVTGTRTITIVRDSRLSSSYNAVIDEVVSRFNAEGLRIKFQRGTSGTSGNTITLKRASGSYLASAGFPTSSGNPYSAVNINSTAIGTIATTTDLNYAATIVAHEIGHCIGFRHTDYMNRSYSCGGVYYDEGASTVGAINIPGTPLAADPNSWMLACIGDNMNRPFNSNDKIALAYLY